MIDLDLLKCYSIFDDLGAQDFDVDFFAYTYEDSKCSCCHGIYDLSISNWRDGTVIYDNPKWILFNNADNLVGQVNSNMIINAYTYIRFSDNLNDTETLNRFVESLKLLLGEAYKIELEDSGITLLFNNDRNDSLYLEVKDYNEQFKSELGLRYFT